MPLLPSVSDDYARALGRFLASRGLPPEPPGPDDDAPPARVAGPQFTRMVSRARDALAEPALGTAFGTCVGGGAFGLLGVAAASAGSLREAIHHLQRFEALTSTLGRLQMRPGPHTVTLVWQPHAPVAPAVVEGILAGWVSFGRYLLAEPVPVLGVSFSHARTASVSQHEAMLNCPVRFGADEHSVTIPDALLELRPRCADETLNTALWRWLDRCTLAVDAPAQHGTAHRVAALLADELGGPDLDEAGIARRLGLGARTLQRRLAAEGVAFRDLLDAARAHHAIMGVLRARRSLVELGADIGFEEQSSLCRAFRRWTGYAPLALRERLVSVSGDLRGA